MEIAKAWVGRHQSSLVEIECPLSKLVSLIERYRDIHAWANGEYPGIGDVNAVTLWSSPGAENLYCDIHDWLGQLGLDQYGEVFAREAIELDTLGQLTDADLRELGVAMGHRKRMLNALKEALTAAPAAFPESPNVAKSP